MNIPAVVIFEAHQTSMNDDEPTRPITEVSKLWGGAAHELAQKLIECSRVKQRCLNVLDVKGSQDAYRFAQELRQIVVVLSNLGSLPVEMAASMRRQSVDRIVAIYEEASHLFVVQ